MSKSKKKKAPTELKSKNITNDHPQEGLSTKDVSSKTKIAVRAAAGIGVVLTVIGIGILINRKLNLTKLLPTPTARQTRLLANEVAKAMGEESARAANDAMTSASKCTSIVFYAICQRTGKLRKMLRRMPGPSGSNSPSIRPFLDRK